MLNSLKEIEKLKNLFQNAEDAKTKAVITIKEDGILAGLEIARSVFNKYDSSLKFNAQVVEDYPAQIVDTRKTIPTLRMLYNMSPEELRKAVQITSGRVIREASGGIDRENTAGAKMKNSYC